MFWVLFRRESVSAVVEFLFLLELAMDSFGEWREEGSFLGSNFELREEECEGRAQLVGKGACSQRI